MKQEHVENFLDLVEPHIEELEIYYDRITESRREIVGAFRRLRPRTTPIPVVIKKKPEKAPKQPEPIKTLAAEQTPSEPVSLNNLEIESEALLNSMGI